MTAVPGSRYLGARKPISERSDLIATCVAITIWTQDVRPRWRVGFAAEEAERITGIPHKAIRSFYKNLRAGRYTQRDTDTYWDLLSAARSFTELPPMTQGRCALARIALRRKSVQ